MSRKVDSVSSGGGAADLFGPCTTADLLLREFGEGGDPFALQGPHPPGSTVGVFYTERRRFEIQFNTIDSALWYFFALLVSGRGSPLAVWRGDELIAHGDLLLAELRRMCKAYWSPVFGE